jgi:hypothetical protein
MTIEELEARLEVATRERDEERKQHARAIYEANCHILQLTDSLNAATRERDEARAELADLTNEWAARRCECGADDFCKIAQERNEARAEVDRLTDASTHWQVMLKREMEEVEWLKRAYEHIRKIHLFSYAAGEQRGARTMREACASKLSERAFAIAPEDAAKTVREMPIPEEP